jgi:hypothetical protein
MNTDSSSEIASAIKSIEATFAKEARLRRITGICKFVMGCILILFLVRPGLFIFQTQFLAISSIILVVILAACLLGGFLGGSAGVIVNKIRDYRENHKK